MFIQHIHRAKRYLGVSSLIRAFCPAKLKRVKLALWLRRFCAEHALGEVVAAKAASKPRKASSPPYSFSPTSFSSHATTSTDDDNHPWQTKIYVGIEEFFTSEVRRKKISPRILYTFKVCHYCFTMLMHTRRTHAMYNIPPTTAIKKQTFWWITEEKKNVSARHLFSSSRQFRDNTRNRHNVVRYVYPKNER